MWTVDWVASGHATLSLCVPLRRVRAPACVLDCSRLLPCSPLMTRLCGLWIGSRVDTLRYRCACPSGITFVTRSQVPRVHCVYTVQRLAHIYILCLVALQRTTEYIYHLQHRAARSTTVCSAECWRRTCTTPLCTRSHQHGGNLRGEARVCYR